MSYTVKEKFDIINGKINEVGENSVNYIFMTDSHVDEYLRRDEDGKLTVYEDPNIINKRFSMIVSHLVEAVKLANENDNIDFVALGGDYINAYNIKGKQAVIDILNASLAPLKNCKKPVIIAFGNHDDNGFQTLNPQIPEIKPEWFITDKDWKEKVLDLYPFAEKRVHDEKYGYSKYFYFDIENKKTRVIVLDTMDMRRPFDENGVACGEPQKTRFWYTFSQLDWLCNKALKCPDGWNYIFVSHLGIDNTVNCNYTTNGVILRDIINAVNKKLAYSFEYSDNSGNTVKVECDFTNIKDGRVLMFNFGHQHGELIYHREDVDLWEVATGTENAWGGWGEAHTEAVRPWKMLKDRTEGTENETCIDVFSVNNKICYKFNVGPGDDAVMKY